MSYHHYMVTGEAHKSRGLATLLDELHVRYKCDVPLGPLTWYGVGGPADLLAHPDNADQLSAILRRCREDEIPFHVLGSGANLLVMDAGVRGMVVKLDAAGFSDIQRDGNTVEAGAGVDLAKLILTTSKWGLAGIETLAGIPASVGGAVKMNAGGKYGEIGAAVESLSTLTDTGTPRTLTRKELRFDYRNTNIIDPIVVDIRFALEPTDPMKLRDRVKEVFAYKKSTQPLADHSAGCAFKNPKDQTPKSAGQLIDEAGLKGLRVGGAEVSPRHANFIVLHMGGTATDVLGLIRQIKQRVSESCGIQLHEEVVIWGKTQTESQ